MGDHRGASCDDDELSLEHQPRWRWIVAAIVVIGSFVVAPLALAQSVAVANHGVSQFDGWVRATLDKMPPHRAGMATGVSPNGDTREVRYVLGRQVGLDVRVVDLLVSLPPGGHLAVDLSRSRSEGWTLGPPPASLGDLSAAGVPMRLVAVRPDGAAWTAHARARVGPMLHVDCWLRTYGHRPGWALGEVMVTASNPAVPDMGAVVPAGFALRFGDARVYLGREDVERDALITAGTTFGDGQARALPVLLVWPGNLGLADYASVYAVRHVAAVGDVKLWPGGNPIQPPGFEPVKWARGLLAEAERRLHTFDAPLVGPNKRSADAGEQGDTIFVAGEGLVPGGVGAEAITYYSALKLAARPCQHLEADGRPLEQGAHPQLVFWDGRAHWHRGVSADQLGKPRSITDAETHGYAGPDNQHFFGFTLAAACRQVDSPACQRLLANWTRVHLLQHTLDPRLATTPPDSSRSVAWELLMAMQFDRCLEDRELALASSSHTKRRLRGVILPHHAMRPVLWDVRVNDARLGDGPWVIMWQAAVEALGLYKAGQHFGVPEATAAGVAMAKEVLAQGWRLQGGRWVCCAQRSLSGDAVYDETFAYYGMSLAPAVVLMAGEDERARGIWGQLTAGAQAVKQTRWLVPGVR